MDYYNNQTYYDILGLPKNGINEKGEKVSLDSINRAYEREKWQQFRYFDDNLEKAYSILSDPEKRREYDRKLEEGTIEIEQPEEVTPEEVTPEEVTPEEVTPEEVTPEEVTPEEVTPEEVTPEEVTPEEVAPEEVTPEEVTPEEVTPEEVTPEEVTPEEVTPEEVAPEEVTPEEVAPEKVTPEEMEDIYSDSTKNPNIVPFAPVEKKQTKEGDSKLKTIGKYAGIVAAGVVLVGVTNTLAIPVLVAVGLPIWLKKHKKNKLQKDKKPKKITKISTEELNMIEEYNQTLDKEINKLLSEPHNNYKLEINKLKYENQIKLMEELLNHKLSKEVKKSQMLKHKLDLVGTKLQLETANKKLEEIEKSISEYEQNQKTTNISKKLAKINEKIIENNEEINKKSEEKSFGISNLKAYQTKLINKRNKKGTKVKVSVLRKGKFYDDIRKAKDFMVSLKYVFKDKEEIDEFLQEGPRMTR